MSDYEKSLEARVRSLERTVEQAFTIACFVGGAALSSLFNLQWLWPFVAIYVIWHVVKFVAVVFREWEEDNRRKNRQRNIDFSEREDLRRRENEVRERLGMPPV
jgi:hypothetical protein